MKDMRLTDQHRVAITRLLDLNLSADGRDAATIWHELAGAEITYDDVRGVTVEMFRAEVPELRALKAGKVASHLASLTPDSMVCDACGVLASPDAGPDETCRVPDCDGRVRAPEGGQFLDWVTGRAVTTETVRYPSGEVRCSDDGIRQHLLVEFGVDHVNSLAGRAMRTHEVTVVQLANRLFHDHALDVRATYAALAGRSDHTRTDWERLASAAKREGVVRGSSRDGASGSSGAREVVVSFQGSTPEAMTTSLLTQLYDTWREMT